MNNTESRKELKEFLDKIDKEQELGPFVTRDSSIKDEYHKKLESNAVRYDDEPVTACPFCNSLYLKDIDDKLECFNCGHEILETDVVIYKSIYDWKKVEKEKDESSDNTDNS